MRLFDCRVSHLVDVTYHFLDGVILLELLFSGLLLN